MPATDTPCVVPAPEQLPLYLAGGDSVVQCWQFGHSIQGRGLQDHLRAQYRLPSGGRAANLRFSPCGEQFGCIEERGSLCLWRFQSGTDVPLPFSRLQCHGRRGSDLCFVGNSVVVASVGLSAGPAAPSLCLWDVLLPPSQALVASCAAHGEGGCCVLHSAADQSLISGGQKGEVAIFDLRKQQRREQWTAHSLATRCVALHESTGLLFTASSDGDIKLWEPRATAATEPSRVVEPTAAAEPKLLGSWPR